MNDLERRMWRPLVGLMVLAGCGPGLVVNTDWNPARVGAIPAWRTYTWLEHVDADVPYEDLDDVRIRDLVASHLATRGYQLVPEGEPADFWVAHHLSIRDHMSVHSPPYYGWNDPWYGPYGGYGYGYGYGYDVVEWQTGVLVVDVVDPESNELVWRGVAESEPLGRVESPQRRMSILGEAIGELFSGFPVAARVPSVSAR